MQTAALKRRGTGLAGHSDEEDGRRGLPGMGRRPGTGGEAQERDGRAGQRWTRGSGRRSLRRRGRRGRGADEDGLLVPATSNSGDEVLGEGEQRGYRQRATEHFLCT